MTTITWGISIPCLAGSHQSCFNTDPWTSKGCLCICHRGGLPPIARTSDPETSHQAAEAVSGQRKSLVKQLLRIILAQPGLTAGEIAEAANTERWAVTKRLSEPKNAKAVIQGAARTWNGRMQVTWWPAQSQGRLLG